MEETADVNNETDNETNGLPPALTSAWTSQKETSTKLKPERVSRFDNLSILEKYPHTNGNKNTYLSANNDAFTR